MYTISQVRLFLEDEDEDAGIIAKNRILTRASRRSGDQLSIDRADLDYVFAQDAPLLDRFVSFVEKQAR